uniref:Doublecortin domain-containing protein n=1 Tax=Scophthalmus maximus TaxID=52904 RepID=A0A8D3DXG3_SCOMX
PDQKATRSRDSSASKHDNPLSLPPASARVKSFIRGGEERRPLRMSSHKRSFQCFNAVGGEGSHKSSLPLNHHNTRLPRITHHGMVGHHEPLEVCCLCSDYRHAQALEALETQVLPLYHTHPPHHHHPHQCVLGRPPRPEDAQSGQGRHIHHHRYGKRVMLVKNSDPSSRKTIVLHRRSIRSLGLFLEEVSELMQYHIRKLCTLEGRKVRSLLLIQCPSVLVCVGREPSHHSIVENFRKTSGDKLPKLRSRVPTQESVNNPKLESDNRSNRQLSTENSLPNGTNSPDNVDSCPPTSDGLKHDDIEKQVRINKDGSLSMEMKVRFQLQNDETLHWSTEYPQGHNNSYFAQASDRSFSEYENISVGEQDEGYITRRFQRHVEETHCRHCCSHCQDYDIWKNIPGAPRCIRTSSSSASSHTMVSRKMVVERQTMSRSSEEHDKSGGSVHSPVSFKSKDNEENIEEGVEAEEAGEDQDRVPSVMSSKSNTSARSAHSKASKPNDEESAVDETQERTSDSEEEVVDTVERAPSTISVKSTKSNASTRSRKSRTSESLKNADKDEERHSEENQHRAPSTMSEKSMVCDLLTEAENGESERTLSAMSARSIKSNVSATSRKSKDVNPDTCDTTDKSSCQSKTSKSNREDAKTATAEVVAEAADIKRVTDNKSDKSNKCTPTNADADDFELVPSNLPNTSPTEVVNEWLKSITTDGDMYDMEELNENCDGQKTANTTEEMNGIEHSENNDHSVAENTRDAQEGVVMTNDCQKSTEAPNADTACTQSEDASKIFQSSVQVMKVLINPKLDRCNSLPEISPVYGRKLSTSARGLLDSLVKLQLIDHDPKNANVKDERYQELMNILKSLWLCDPPENEYVLKKVDRHYMDDEFNHASSSGVDVNSGSTGSGKEDVEGTCEEKQEDDPATDDTIRNDDSPTELPETPPSSGKSLENDSNGQKVSEEDEKECQEDTASSSPPLIQGAQLAKNISQDPDPVWVLTLLNKIEKQFMTHYIDAMKEFKVRWNLDDNEQLEMMISELKTEVHKRIQASIERELRKIQGRAGLPTPPKEAKSRASTTRMEDRRRRLNIMLKQSVDQQGEKSDDSATGTSYSDQRSENDDYCPCESCIKNKMTSRPPLPAEVLNIAPVSMDFDLKRILVMKNNDPGKTQDINRTFHSGNDTETNEAEALVEKVIAQALTEVEGDEKHHDTEDDLAVAADVKEATAEDELAEEREIAVTGEDEVNAETVEDKITVEAAVEAISEHASDKDEAMEEGTVHEEEDTAATSEDELNEDSAEATTAEGENTAVEEGLSDDKEDLASTSGDDLTDENNDTVTADESSKETDEKAETEDVTAEEQEVTVTSEGESEDEPAKNEADT